MTSVICSVCSQSIASENDRIYCFGGCEQILHTRCSDLSPAGAKAVRENSGLKYMCFDCRKKQTSLNDIQKQCGQLAKKVDDLFECVCKNNLALPGLVNAEIDRNNAVLLASILSALRDTGRNCSLPTCTPESESLGIGKHSYANVVQQSNQLKAKKRKAPDNLESNREKRKFSSENTTTDIDTAFSYEDGGLLRSGKRRRNIVNQSNDNVTRTPLLLPHPQDSPCPRSPQRKSNTVLKMEQTVLIKPNQTQPAETTKRVICEKLDPVEFAVKELRLKETG